MKRIEFTTDYSIYVTKGGGGDAGNKAFIHIMPGLNFRKSGITIRTMAVTRLTASFKVT